MTTQKRMRITVEGKSYDVLVEVLDEATSGAYVAPIMPMAPMAAPVAAPSHAPAAPVALGNGVVPAPLAGVVMKILVKPGDKVQVDQRLLSMESMKMETFVNSPHAGTIREILVKPGDNVTEGQPIVKMG